MKARTKDDQTATIVEVHRTGRTDATYNLTVDEFETYFVGGARILVHNCDRRTLRVDTAEVGDKVKTPDTDSDQFTRLKGGQGMKDQESGLIWQKSNSNHSGDSAGEFKVGTSKGEQPTKSDKITVTRSDGCVYKKDGC